MFVKTLLELFISIPMSERVNICHLFARTRLFRYSEGKEKAVKKNLATLEKVLDFMISHAHHFRAIPVVCIVYFVTLFNNLMIKREPWLILGKEYFI